MKVRMFNNMLKQGFIGAWRNRMMSTASISSVTAVLVILGIVIILILNINNVAMLTKEQFDEIHVYIKDDVTQEQIDNLGDTINNYDGVFSLIYQSKEQALEIMKKDWGEEGYLLDGLEENPLPNSYVIQLEDIEYADEVVTKLSGLSAVEDIKYFKDILDQLMTVANFVRVGGLIIIGVLMMVSIFIISNTIKITVAARKREINIMKYVGATNGFIRGPFIFEGILLGLVGAAISILIVYFGYRYLFTVVNEELYVLFTVYMIPYKALFNDIAIMFGVIGIGIGTLGSIISLRKFLNV